MHLKDKWSAITHFISMLMAIFAGIPLLIKAAQEPSKVYVISLSIYVLSMILLYFASTIYHSLDISERVNRNLRKFDHMMIFVLIAGTYTPVCLIALKGTLGIVLLSIVWGIAIIGIVVKALWINCPKWFSSALYISMGWTCVIAFTRLLDALTAEAFGWLLAGGIIYTVGGVIYALKLPVFNKKFHSFGSHEIFHLFVTGGSICHFIVMCIFLI